ncbi:MAG: chromate transporter, partial [Candidatus Aureabacteria bacterium]|nr:chromate transporter [Candidatus Auribacterota bacterium]
MIIIMIYIQLFFTFLKIGLFTVGSGYSMLVLAERYVVVTYHWLTVQEFTDLVAISEVTPGPIIFNLATFVGTKVAGMPGAIIASLGLVTMPFLALYLIAIYYPVVRDYPRMKALMSVIRPIAIAFITLAVLKLFKTSITDLRSALIAVAVILLTYVADVSPIIIVIGGVLLALLVG